MTTTMQRVLKEWELIWSNASPTSSFAGQTISIDFSKYSWIQVELRVGTTNDSSIYVLIPVDTGLISIRPSFQNSYYHSTSSGNPTIAGRTIYVRESGLEFNDGVYRRSDSSDSTSNTTSNSYAIPTRIWAKA